MNETNLKFTFGKIIREYRHSIGISQEELAARTYLHRTYISEVERGERNVSLVNIVKIADGLEIPSHQLFRQLDKEEESFEA